jgi:hypothetical protein
LDDQGAVWVASVADRAALVRLIRAALSRGVAQVDIEDPHLGPGTHPLQLRLHGRPLVVLAAELAGETPTGEYALRLAPLDPSHLPELTAMAEGDGRAPLAAGPMSARVSELFDTERSRDGHAEPASMRPAMATVPDLEPEGDDADEDADELGASVLFDPEAALISRAPPRPDGTGPEDTLTIPVRASMMPPEAVPPSVPRPPPRRPPSGPHTISHLSFPQSVVASTQPYPHLDDLRTTTEMVAVPEHRAPREPERPRHEAERLDGTLDTLASATSDLDAVTGEVNTERLGQPWSDDGGADGDTSHGGSVVFDPDVLTREQQRDSRPPRHVHRPGLGEAAADELDDDLATESTTPGIPSSRSSPSSEVSSSGGPTTVYRHGNDGIVVVGRVIANRYRIDALIGTGAVGAVYRASHVELPRTFALKVLHPHFRADPHLLASFRTEARAASLLDHPNVTIVHDFGEEPDGLVYIVMEYLNGASLQALLDEQRRVEPRRAVELMVQVCAALAAAHERGIVHRDIKPDNIMLVRGRDDEGGPVELVKVCDFGIAALEAAPDASTGAWAAGTPEYMAPEQAQGRSDARTDVYACGIVLYEMLTGRPPFVGDSPASTLSKHLNEPPRRPSELIPGLSPQLEALILRAIDKAPERRFSSMRELRNALKRLRT